MLPQVDLSEDEDSSSELISDGHDDTLDQNEFDQSEDEDSFSELISDGHDDTLDQNELNGEMQEPFIPHTGDK